MATTLLTWEAASAIYPAANPAQLGYTSGTNFPWLSLNFDTTTAEFAYFVGVMPQSYAAGNITVNLYWTATTTGDVVWGCKFLGRVDDEVLDAAISAQSKVTDSVTAGNDLMVGAITLTTPALVAGDLVIVEIERVTGDGADTLAADAKLIAVEFQE